MDDAPHAHSPKNQSILAQTTYLRSKHLAMLFYVYILASQKNGTLYTGHTDDLPRRIFDHREGRGSAFTRKYGVTRLVWFEGFPTRDEAKRREYQIKAWKRAWKIRLIETVNPNWDDLYLKLNSIL